MYLPLVSTLINTPKPRKIKRNPDLKPGEIIVHGVYLQTFKRCMPTLTTKTSGQ